VAGKYTKNLDYLVAGIGYLGANPYWVGRSASEMADELSLEKPRVQEMFETFPSIFRRSKQSSNSGERYYSLQARYAQRKTKAGDESEMPDIAPLSLEQMSLLYEFVTQAARDESAALRHWAANGVSVFAAIIAASAAIYATTAKARAPDCGAAQSGPAMTATLSR